MKPQRKILKNYLEISPVGEGLCFAEIGGCLKCPERCLKKTGIGVQSVPEWVFKAGRNMQMLSLNMLVL